MKWLIIYEIKNSMLKTTSTLLTVTTFLALVTAQDDGYEYEEYEYEEYDDGYEYEEYDDGQNEYVEDDYY